MRTRNSVETEPVKISTTPWAVETLNALAKTGRFGKNASEVADELLRAKLREVEADGWLDKGRPKRRARGD